MDTGRAVLLLLAMALLAAVTTTAIDDHTRAASAGGFDCRLITGTPTATGTPSPTPPWIPYFAINICNDTAAAASDLHLVLSHPAVNFDPGRNAPGCPMPGYAHSGGDPPQYTVVDINYGTPCVDPGESVYVFLYPDCTTPSPGCEPPVVACFYWTLSGQPVPSVSPAVNPSRCQNAAPVPTPPTPTPTPPVTPTPPLTPAPSPTPTPTPSHTQVPATATPTRTPGSSATPVVTAAALPRTGGASSDSSLMVWLLFAGVALSVAGFALLRRGATR